MSSNVVITQVPRSAGAIERFLKISYSIYDGSPYWVAPLLMDLKKVFTDENPLFQHAEMQLWVATRDGKDVGRIAGIIDRNFVARFGSRVGTFGFYECRNDPDASHELFQACFAWLRSRECDRVLGPVNPTTNDECGLLIQGFEASPAFMMPYNPPYYEARFESEGLKKAKDLLAYHIDMATIPMDRLLRISERVKKRNPEVALRPVRRKTLAGDLAKVKEVYNAAWEDNWGFVPMTDAEVDFMAERLSPLLFEGLIWLAEVGSEPVGFLLAMPDYNPALKPLNGRVLTPRILGFIPYVLGWRKPEGTRVLTLGVKDRFRTRGLETALLIEGLKVGFDSGFKVSEASWILEDNLAMCRIIEAIEGRVSKRYRLYERSLP